jgi:hypothetical protein
LQGPGYCRRARYARSPWSCDGAVEILLEVVGDASIVEGQGEIRVELIVVRNGAIGLSLGTVCDTSVVVSIGEIWIEPDSLVEIRDDTVPVAPVIPILMGQASVLYTFCPPLTASPWFCKAIHNALDRFGIIFPAKVWATILPFLMTNVSGWTSAA